MVVTLIHVYHEDKLTGSIGMKVNLPWENSKYCLEIVKVIERIKNDIIVQAQKSEQNKIENEKNFIRRVFRMFSTRLSKSEKLELTSNLKELETATRIGNEIQTTMTLLSETLVKISEDERNKLIQDVSASIKNLIGGA